MKPEVSARLVEINTVFYQSFGQAFAATRRRIQPGVRRMLNHIPLQGDWLDLGCGSGALALEWAGQGRSGSYTGLDFSSALLNEARESSRDQTHAGLTIKFLQGDLSQPDWPELLNGVLFDGVLAFAALHHLPGRDLRLNILRQVRSLLKAKGLFIHSEWQFQNSPKLLSRVLPWQNAGLNSGDVEEGDTLLDWRFALPGQSEAVGLRYVHCFSSIELAELATQTGFKILNEFYSDGAGGRLGFYQVWQAV